MARATIFYLRADRMGWERGISCGETRNSKWRRLELWWPLSFSDKLTATPPGSFSLSFPLYLSVSLPWRPLRHRHTVLSVSETGSRHHRRRSSQWEAVGLCVSSICCLIVWGCGGTLREAQPALCTRVLRKHLPVWIRAVCFKREEGAITVKVETARGEGGAYAGVTSILRVMSFNRGCLARST